MDLHLRQAGQIPQPLKARIHGLSHSLPSAPEDRHRLLHRYAQHRGYEFLSEHSKLHRYFSLKLSGAGELRASEMAIENETAIRMEGSLEEISVGGMCEIVKENLGKGAGPYQPIQLLDYQQEFTFGRDEELFTKAVNLLHNINLQKLEQKASDSGPGSLALTHDRSIDKISQTRKQMTVRQDGSLGAWGGRKYEGLGSSNQFTTFRREKSQNYYQHSSHAQKNANPK